MKKIFIGVFLLFSFLTMNNVFANSEKTNTTFENIKVKRVYDGDTIFVDLNCSEELFCKNIGVRLLGIDTPEIRTKDECEKKKALEAKKYVEDKINNAKEIDIINPTKGKYFRIVGDVVLDGQSLSQDLIKNDLAVSYDGGKKEKINWCKYYFFLTIDSISKHREFFPNTKTDPKK